MCVAWVICGLSSPPPPFVIPPSTSAVAYTSVQFRFSVNCRAAAVVSRRRSHLRQRIGGVGLPGNSMREPNRSYATQCRVSGFDPTSFSALTSTSTCRFGYVRGTARYQLPTSFWQRPLHAEYQEQMLLWPVGPVKGE
jgi:hypothetical protein